MIKMVTAESLKIAENLSPFMKQYNITDFSNSFALMAGKRSELFDLQRVYGHEITKTNKISDDFEILKKEEAKSIASHGVWADESDFYVVYMHFCVEVLRNLCNARVCLDSILRALAGGDDNENYTSHINKKFDLILESCEQELATLRSALDNDDVWLP